MGPPPRFGGRVLKIRHPDLPGEEILLGGAFSRFVNNLHSPYHYFVTSREHWAELWQRDNSDPTSQSAASGTPS
jgi:hypothetical protein